jgi:plasmid stabilization system protein ParE
MTVRKLSQLPDLGRVRHFRNPMFHGLRSFRVDAPFERFLIFYRVSETTLLVWRLMAGSRDLPRRLAEPPI